ncbi:uncharacterized protein LOC110426019 [Herrania umbratica]|uniref:Uncharacterized protein LOC110426019 n=1 Tax=Herrania umbratica TaxID=108875 RepID=A0A6J1BCB1_9ROSI|nr:uncharacterized protein LOC110426019 [Herrania umbratica]
MEATSVSSFRLAYRRRPLRLDPKYWKKSPSFIVASCRGSDGPDYVGKLVGESMIVLRLRIKEIKISENRVELPSDWMEWEKQYFPHYNEDVFEAMGLLQNFLMNMRPSLAVGMVALVLLSVPLSSGLTLFQALQIAQGFISRFNPS